MNQSERRLFLIQSLLKEDPAYRDIRIPADTDGQRQLLRGLLNVRAPQPGSEDFLQVQDAYLQQRTAEKGITDAAALAPIQPGLYLWQGDITTLQCDAIPSDQRATLISVDSMAYSVLMITASPLVGAAGDLTGHAGTGLVVLGALVAASAFAALWWKQKQ